MANTAGGDLYKRPQSGDKLDIPAPVWRAILDTVDYVKQLRNKTVPTAKRKAVSDFGVVEVKNTSGAAVDRFGILGIDTAWPDPGDNLQAFKNGAILHCITPDEDLHVGKFVVMLEPLPINGIGLACVSGVVPVQIEVAYEDRPYADILDAEAGKLGSDWRGAAEILYCETGTGTKWAIVRLGSLQKVRVYGVLDEALDPDDSATVSVWVRNSPLHTYITSTEDKTVWASPLQGSTSVALGKWIGFEWNVHRNCFEAVAREC